MTTSEPSWIAPFTGLLSPSAFGKLVAQLRREGADASGRGRPWKLSLEDRVLLETAYCDSRLRCSGCRSLQPTASSTTSARSSRSSHASGSRRTRYPIEHIAATDPLDSDNS